MDSTIINRPRPRKIITVVSSATRKEDSGTPSEKERSVEGRIPPASEESLTMSGAESSIRKPIVASIRKVSAQSSSSAPAPPPPTYFSESPRQSPSSAIGKAFSNTAKQSVKVEQPNFSGTKNSDSPSSLSPKSADSSKTSGEAFLDAADRAADYIGGALLNSFKSLNLKEAPQAPSQYASSMVQFSNDNEPEEDPFADIMKRLKPTSTDESNVLTVKSGFSSSDNQNAERLTESRPAHVTPSSTADILRVQNLIDEEPPESFSQAFFASSDSRNERDETISEVLNASLPKDHDIGEMPSMKKSTSSPQKVSPRELLSIQSIHSQTSEHSSASSFFSSQKTTSPTSSSPGSDASLANNGIRSSLFRHGLSALEKIGKTTAEAVVNTRNKLVEPKGFDSIDSSRIIEPDFTDTQMTFFEVFQIYGGYTKLQTLQLKSIRTSIAMKHTHKKTASSAVKRTSFDYNVRKDQTSQIASILHPDKIMEGIDDENGTSRVFTGISDAFPAFSKYADVIDDDLDCLRRLLRSLDTILIVPSKFVDSDGGESREEILASNRRRHVLCQVETIFCDFIEKLLHRVTLHDENIPAFAQTLSLFTGQLIKHIQLNFEKNCDARGRADKDQQVAIKLLLDIAYCAVPQLQHILLQ